MKIELVNRRDTNPHPISADISNCVDDLISSGKKREILDELGVMSAAGLNSLKAYTVQSLSSMKTRS